MHPNEKMAAVIGGKRYTVGKSTLIADDEYWDGHNFEHRGRNTFLYKTPNGNYFRVDLTMWQGESDKIVSLTKDQAKNLYENLHEKEVTYKAAFGESPEEA